MYKTKNPIGKTLTCAVCGKEFIKTSPNQKCCSEDCSHTMTNEKVKLRMRVYYAKKRKEFEEQQEQ